MNESETAYCVRLLKQMAALEVALADFYAACASRRFNEPLCTRISNEELGHANCFKSMADTLKERKGVGFTEGQPISFENVAAFSAYIKEQTRAVVEGKLPHGNAFAVAAGMERRFLDSRYAEIVKTEDPECAAMMDTILKETAAHVTLMSGGS